MVNMSLKTIATGVGLSLEEILDVSEEEFQRWSRVGCNTDVLTHACIYREWKELRNEAGAEITCLEALCEQAGATLQEIVTLSAKDFRHLTRVMNVGITQHTLVFQEKNMCLEAMTRAGLKTTTSLLATSFSSDCRLKRSHPGDLLVDEEHAAAAEKGMNILLLAAGGNVNKRGRTQKSHFTEHEDKIIIEKVTASEERPFTRWAELSNMPELAGYKSKQIRDRWVNHLDPVIKHEPFSRNEVSLVGPIDIYMYATRVDHNVSSLNPVL